MTNSNWNYGTIWPRNHGTNHSKGSKMVPWHHFGMEPSMTNGISWVRDSMVAFFQCLFAHYFRSISFRLHCYRFMKMAQVRKETFEIDNLDVKLSNEKNSMSNCIIFTLYLSFRSRRRVQCFKDVKDLGWDRQPRTSQFHYWSFGSVRCCQYYKGIWQTLTNFSRKKLV